MSSHRGHIIQPGMGYLRLDTQDLSQKNFRFSPPSMLPTPISANCDDRKSSISSFSWSFVDQPCTSSSQPSSVESFQSCPEPSTPQQNQGSQLEYVFGTSSTLHDDLSSPSDHYESKSTYIPGPVFAEQSPDIVHSSTELHPSQYWMYMHRHTSTPLYDLQFHGTDGIMQGCGDFSSAIGSSLVASTSSFHDASSSYRYSGLRPWEAPHQIQMDGLNHAFRGISSQSMAEHSEYAWPLPVRAIVPSSVDTSTPTIIPSETMPPPIFCADHKSEMDDYDLDGDSHGLPSPMSDTESITHYHHSVVKTEAHDSGHGEDRSVSRNKSRRLMCVSKTGAKGLKKEVGSSAWRKRNGRGIVTKRRAREPRTTTYDAKLNGGDVKFSYQESSAQRKDHVCKEPCSSGSWCGKAFERVEHLKRHQKTHRSLKNIPCPLDVEEFKCDKSFSDRRDNWRDHLKTHLKISSASRNNRCTPEQMYDALRKNEDPAEAEKTIGMLEGWIAKGGLLANSSAPTRQRP